ncbi:hypothetical protein HPG69_003410, partial [Diceros bicornis minor]
MSRSRALLLICFILPGLLLSEATKILTLSLVGGSHHLLMDQVTQILQDHAHNVTMLLQIANLLITGICSDYFLICSTPGTEQQCLLHRKVLKRKKNHTKFSLDFHLKIITKNLRTILISLWKKFWLTDNFFLLFEPKSNYFSDTNECMYQFENFIAKYGDSGFVLVALSSKVSRSSSQEVLKEMNSAFAHLPQGVIWKSHPHTRLFVTHGGMNSIIDAIQHGVPMVGIPLFGDQLENLLQVEAKKVGVFIHLKQINAETLAVKMKQVIEDKRYKSAAVAASIIRGSHPVIPAQRLVGWVNHILQTGGAAHLKHRSFQQQWHEQYLLNVRLFMVVTMGTMWLCGKLRGVVA